MFKAKQKLTSIVVACVMMIACVFGAIATLVMPQTTAVAATESYSYTFAAKQFSANGTKTLNGVNWTAAGDGNYWGYDGTKGQQFGSGSKPYKNLTLTSATSADNAFTGVSKITINTSGAKNVDATFTVSVNGTTVGTSPKLTNSATSYTFEVNPAISGNIQFTYTQTSSVALYIKSIEVVYGAENSAPETPAIPVELTNALNNATATMSLSYSYTVTSKPIPAGVTFEFGENRDPVHTETTLSISSYTETVDDYTLTLNGIEKVFKDSCDAKGNSCLKLGTGSAIAKFNFTVPSDIEKVIFAITGYKANKASVKINEKSYSIETTSENGEYTFIEIDTTTTKTINFSTNSTPDERAMLNSITFVSPDMTSDKTQNIVEEGKSQFYIKFAVTADWDAIKNIVDENNYGIRISTDRKPVPVTYAIEKCQGNDGKYYVIINLGDIFNDKTKLETKFTVQAYAMYNGIETLPEDTNATKTLSVKDMVEMYYGMNDYKADVEHLYQYLTTGKIN